MLKYLKKSETKRIVFQVSNKYIIGILEIEKNVTHTQAFLV